MLHVTSQHEVLQVEDILGRADDPWADFREIEVINLEFVQQYRHSLGKYSKFFIALEENRFLATQCPNCQKVYAPPRPLCPDCAAITTWIELSGLGRLETYSIMHFGSGANPDVAALVTPYILAYVLLDGASTLFPHILHAPLEAIKIGMRVKVVYNDTAVWHPIHLMHFAPVE